MAQARQELMPLQGWRVFISYPHADLDIARAMAALLERHGAEVRYWDRDRTPGRGDWDLIRSWILWANCVVGIVTRRALDDSSLGVGEEVGVADTHGKLVIPILERGVPRDRLGMVRDRVCIALDPANPWDALGQLCDVLMKETEAFNARVRQGALALGGLLLVAMLFGQGE